MCQCLSNQDKITPGKHICHLQCKTSLSLIEFTVLFSFFITSLKLMFTFHVPRRGTGKGQVKNKLPLVIFTELFLVNGQTYHALISSFICTCLQARLLCCHKQFLIYINNLSFQAWPVCIMSIRAENHPL